MKKTITRNDVLHTLSRIILLANGVYIAYRFGIHHESLGEAAPLFAALPAAGAFATLCWLLWKQAWAERTARRITLPLGAAAFVATALTNELHYDVYLEPLFPPANDLLPILLIIFVTCLISVLPFLLWCSALDHMTTFVRRAYARFSGMERALLFTLAAAVLLGIAFAYVRTCALYSIRLAEGSSEYDVLFTADSAFLAPPYYAFGKIQSPENDLRNLLFGLFGLPLHVLAECTARLFPSALTYFLSLAVFQNIFLCFAFLNFLHVLPLGRGLRCCMLMVYAASYPFLLYSVLLEQYVVAVAWLFIFLGSCFMEDARPSLPYAAATGSLFTSGIFVLVLIRWSELRRGNIRKALRPLFKPLLCLAALITCSGQLRYFLQPVDKYADWMGGDAPILQYINMIATLVFPARTESQFVVFLRQAHVDSLNPLGIAVLALALAGFALNHRSRIAQICLGWIIFSAALLCIVQYGVAENNLVLYSLYFSWAFLLLICMGVNRLLQRHPVWLYAFYGGATAVLLTVNLPVIYEMIQFGSMHFPVP